MRTKYSRQ